MLRKAVFLLGLLSIVTLYACAYSKSEQQVARAAEALRVAMIDPDSVTLKRLVSEQLSYGHSTGMVQNRASFIEALMSGKSDFVTIDITGQTINVTGDVAIVRHTLSATTNDNGHPGTTKLAIMLVWKKSHKHWILLARQAVRAA
jgi:hypothetical protein